MEEKEIQEYKKMSDKEAKTPKKVITKIKVIALEQFKYMRPKNLLGFDRKDIKLLKKDNELEIDIKLYEKYKNLLKEVK